MSTSTVDMEVRAHEDHHASLRLWLRLLSATTRIEDTIRQRLRERGDDVPVIVYTGNADVESAVRAMRKGAFTVIQKPFSNELLIEQVREAITSGQRIRRRRAAIRDAQHKLALLTERELSIARELSTGKSAREVASALGLSSRTVEAQRANIFRKGDLNSSVALARLILLAEFGDD